jgi:putative hydrolase of the HAD superfamily
MQYSTLLFDLDDTLYESGNGLWDTIRNRMSRYMEVRLHIPVETIPTLREYYFKTYGTTLRGLQIHYGVDADDYLKFVHDIPLGEYLHEDRELRKLLNSLPQSKYVFTNADANHASRVLQVLGVESCMNGIIDVKALDFSCKPEIEAYEKALQIAHVDHPDRCVYFDDIPANLEPAKKLGVFTVLVGNSKHPSIAHRSIKRLLDLSDEFPELW